MIDKLLKKSDKCLFVSPHLDDVVFSTGGLMSYMNQKEISVSVANVFTNPGLNSSLSARRYTRMCGYSSGKGLYRSRKKEDAKVMRILNVDVVNLDYVEALWRKKSSRSVLSPIARYIPEVDLMYPSYRSHVIKGRLHKDDRETVSEVRKSLVNIISHGVFDFVFCPLGVGSHVDHILVRESMKAFDNIIYYSESPYNQRMRNYGDCPTTYHKCEFEVDVYNKLGLMKLYETQYSNVFPKNTNYDLNEIYFVPNE